MSMTPKFRRAGSLRPWVVVQRLPWAGRRGIAEALSAPPREPACTPA